MIYSIAIENTFNNNLTKKIVDLSTISPSTITDPTIPYIEYVSDQKERLDGYIYLPLYKRNQFCIIPPNSVLTVETENSDEAIFYVSQKLEFSKITSNPDPITGILSSIQTLINNLTNTSEITKQTIVDYLNKSIDITSVPVGITSLGYGAFGNCENIEEIQIPGSITDIGNSCFAGCNNLITVSLPESLKNIGNSCFYNCSTLESITIPDTVENMGNYCFSGCSGLQDINIPKSVSKINSGTFTNCTSLVSIHIPSNITSIAYGTFQGCTNLVDIYIEKEQGSISGSPWGASNATIHWNS